MVEYRRRLGREKTPINDNRKKTFKEKVFKQLLIASLEIASDGLQKCQHLTNEEKRAGDENHFCGLLSEQESIRNGGQS